MKFYCIGWCKEDNHDKVWGAIVLSTPTPEKTRIKYITFWGRRGKKLQTLIRYCPDEVSNVWRLKVKKGYTAIDRERLDQVYPEFQSDLEKLAVYSILRGE